MKLHKFNKNKSLSKLKFKQNRNKNIKVISIVLSVVILFLAIIYFSFARFETDSEVYHLINGTVGTFEKYIDVLFDTDGGTLDTTSVTLRTNSVYGNLPTPSKEGYKFVGWNGKNLFNDVGYRAYFYSYGLPYSEDSSVIIINNISINSLSFTINSNDHVGLLTNNIQLKPNTTYTLSFFREDVDVATEGVIYRNYFYSIDSNGNYQYLIDPDNRGLVNASGKVEVSFTTTDTGLVAFLWAKGNNNLGSSVSLSDIMLEEQESATEYEPYYILSDTKITRKYDHVLYAKWAIPKITNLELWQRPNTETVSTTKVTIGSNVYTSISENFIAGNYWYGNKYNDIELLVGTQVYITSSYGTETRWYNANDESAYVCTGSRLIGTMPNYDISLFVYPDVKGHNNAKRRIISNLNNIHCD